MNTFKKEMTKVVLLTTQRSGSTFIRLWLNNHPNVRCHSEIFLGHYPARDSLRTYCEANKCRRLLYNTFRPRGRRKVTKAFSNCGMKRLIENFLDELYNNPSFSAPWTDMTTDTWEQYQPRKTIDEERAVGFHLMYSQLSDYGYLERWIKEQNVFIIHLIRQNALKILLSLIIARETNEYQFARDRSTQKVFVDPQKIVKQLDIIVNSQEEMKGKFPNNPYLEITYERFFHNYSEEARSILDFLKIENIKVEGPKFLEKMNPDSLKDLIDNYEEIVAVLKGTAYQSFLE